MVEPAPLRLLTVGSLPPEWGGPLRGGVATFHAAILAELLRRSTEIEVVGTMPPSPLDREIPVPALVRSDGVGRAAFYEEQLQRLRPDVVLMNHIANTVGATHATLPSPPPALGVVHSWHNVTFREGEERQRALTLTAEALGGMSAVAVPSRYALDEGRRLGLPLPASATAIHYPLPPLHMEEVDVSAPRRGGVVYLGSLVARKEPAALVEAAALLPDLSVTFVGEGELETDLRDAIFRRGLADRVRLAGALPGPGHLRRVRELLLSADALCLPSRSESFGIVFIEALACGTPIVGFGPTVREIRDAMQTEVGVPLDSSTPEGIAAALERIDAVGWDRPLLRRAALDAFGLPRIADRYLDLLRGIAR